MPFISVAANIIFAIIVFFLLRKIIHNREDRKQRGIISSWPISQIPLDRFDSRFRAGVLGPSRQTEIRFLPSYGVKGGISDFETWILCNLAKTSKTIFEFGTCTGKTTYLLAANSAADTKITTLTLDPANLNAYQSAPIDKKDAEESAMNEAGFTTFLYSGTIEGKKITQLFSDSKTFDETPWRRSCDLVFVDGSHAKSYVESDSRKALAMVNRGGIVLWHDYRGPRRAQGVFQALNKLNKRLPLFHISGTCLVVYQEPYNS